MVLAGRESGLGRAPNALRVSQPFNMLTTTSVRWWLRATGRSWPWAVAHLHRVGAVAD